MRQHPHAQRAVVQRLDIQPRARFDAQPLSQGVGQADLTFVADGDLHGGFRLIRLHLTVCQSLEISPAVSLAEAVTTRSASDTPHLWISRGASNGLKIHGITDFLGSASPHAHGFLSDVSNSHVSRSLAGKLGNQNHGLT